MARSNNQDRPVPPHARAPYPSQPAEPGLPWADAGAAPADPQYAQQQGFDPSLGNLPWPPQQTAPPQPQHQQPYPPQSYPSQAPQGYPPQQGYLPQQGYGAPPQLQPYPQPQHYAGDQAYQPEPPQAAPPPYPPQGYAQDQNHHTAPPLRGSYGPNDGDYQSAPGYDQPGYDQQGYDRAGYDLGRYATQPHAGQQRPQLPIAPPQGLNPAYGAPNNQHPGFAPQPPARVAQQARADDGDEEEYDEDFDDFEEPRRRFGFLKIAASLIIAVGLGGGAAYGYKIYGGKLFGTHHPVVLRADAAPVKSTPTNLVEPQPEHGERVASAMPDVVPSDDANVGGAPAGARRVQTIPISPEPSSQSAPGPAIRPTITMPGLAVEASPSAPPQAPQAPVAPQKMTNLTTPPAPPAARPVIKTISAAASSDEAPPAQPHPRVAKKVVVARAPKVDDSYSATQGSGTANVATASAAIATTAPTKAGGNGYVAVLFSSQGDAVAARKQLDALQSKYPNVLGSKPTDITPFKKKDGTAYLRGIVGPPGSRQAAAEVCTQLKAAGHTDCFITAY